MMTYQSPTLKTVYPQLHHDTIKYCLKIRPLKDEEVMDFQMSFVEPVPLLPDTKLEAGDRILYEEQGLYYEVKFLKG